MVKSKVLISIVRKTPKLRDTIVNLALQMITQDPNAKLRPAHVSYLGAFDSLIGLLTSEIRVPNHTTYIYGAQDSYLLDAQKMGVKVEIILDAGHNCMNGHEEDVVKLITKTMTNIDYEIVTLTSANNIYKVQLEQLSATCFGWMSDSEASKQENEDKYFNNEKFLHILAIINGEIIGKVGLVKRNISYEGSPIVLGGLGGVCTASDQREKGVASVLIQKGMEELKNAGCDIAYLCTDVEDAKLVRLYGKAGFKVLGKKHSYFGKSGKLYVEDDAMISPVNSPAKYNNVMNGTEIFHIGRGNW